MIFNDNLRNTGCVEYEIIDRVSDIIKFYMTIYFTYTANNQ